MIDPKQHRAHRERCQLVSFINGQRVIDGEPSKHELRDILQEAARNTAAMPVDEIPQLTEARKGTKP